MIFVYLAHTIGYCSPLTTVIAYKSNGTPGTVLGSQGLTNRTSAFTPLIIDRRNCKTLLYGSKSYSKCVFTLVSLTEFDILIDFVITIEVHIICFALEEFRHANITKASINTKSIFAKIDLL